MPNLICGDCLDKLKELPENSVDAVVTDPPYGLSFMGKKWDYDVPSEAIWRECSRVLKPGGHLLAFAGTRTQHRMAVRIEDAGFEIRDMIAWIYGSGFPKSLDVSKAIDKETGNIRERVPGGQGGNNSILGSRKSGEAISGEAISGEASAWNGWGTALKPALEPVTVARKPLSEKTVAANVLKWGTGAINIDGGRIESELPEGRKRHGGGSSDIFNERGNITTMPSGRFPANLIHDGSDEVLELFPETKSGKPGGVRKAVHHWNSKETGTERTGFGDSGSAARFFYCAKASKRDRDEGCEKLPVVAHQSGMAGAMPIDDEGKERDRFTSKSRNHHPTVKPTDLMRYLCRLVTPPGGIVLDPFMGSGSTGKAARLEGFDFIGIEKDPEYFEIAKARIAAVKK